MAASERYGRLFVVDQGRRDAGHHITTTAALADAARRLGMEVVLAGCVDQPGDLAMEPVFRHSLYEYEEPLREPVPFDPARRSGPRLPANSVDLLEYARRRAIGAADILLFHTASSAFLASVVDYLACTPARAMASHHFVFRYDLDADLPGGGAAVFADAVRRLSGLGLLDTTVFLYAETEALADHYTEVGGHAVATLHHFSAWRPATASAPVGPVRVTYLGESREEKGFDALHRAVEALGGALDDRVRFVVQAYDAGPYRAEALEAALAHFDSAAYRARHDVHGALDAEDYGELLRESDVLVLPHRAPAFARRGSGVFVDGLVHGKVMVVREGTWMAAACPTDLAVRFRDDADLPRAIAEAADRAEALRDRPPPGVDDVPSRHTAEANVRAVLRAHRAARDVAQARPPRVLHIAPFWVRQGSTRVYEAQLALLAEMGASVFTVHLANFDVGPAPSDENHAWYLREAPHEGAVLQWLLAADPAARTHARDTADRLANRTGSWLHEWVEAGTYEIPWSLAAFLEAAPVDLVVLNYVHNLPLVRRLGLADVPVIVETHDIRARQFHVLAPGGRPGPEDRDEAAEFGAMAEADGLVFINAREAEDARAAGVAAPSTTVLPTLPLPLDTAWPSALAAEDLAARHAVFERIAARIGEDPGARARAAELYEALARRATVGARIVCFLGSDHYWNVASLEWFYERVFLPRLAEAGVELVVAGRVATPFEARHGRPPGILLVGEMTDPAVLYESGIGVVLPVRGGTGFPIKTLEALLAGVPVVACSPAFRGFEYLAETATIADDPDAFADAVLALPQGGAAAGEPMAHPELLWSTYRERWADLVERVRGAPLAAGGTAAARPRPRRAPPAFQAPAPAVPLALPAEGWTCSAATRSAFLEAAHGFRPLPVETRLCWTADFVCGIALEIDGTVEAIAFDVVAVLPARAGSDSQHAIVFRDALPVGPVEVTAGEALVVPVPPDPDARRRRVSIEFVIPEARVGLAAGRWSDPRPLGFAIAAITPRGAPR